MNRLSAGKGSARAVVSWAVMCALVAVSLIMGPTKAFSLNVGDINTIAGIGIAGFSGDGGAAAAAKLNYPASMVFGSAGNLFIADYGNNRIRKVTPSGTITTVAGTGTAGFSGDGGPATAAMLNTPFGVAIDGAGNLFIAEYGNQRIRKVDTSGKITTVAGTGIAGFSGDGGPATAAMLCSPYGVAVDSAGNLFIADAWNDRIRMVDTSGKIITIAGTKSPYSGPGDGGPATLAVLEYPTNLFFDNSGNLFITSYYGNRIRKIDTNGMISTVAGNGAAGFSGDGGPATSAMLSSPFGVTIDYAGNMFIADFGNNRIRKVDTYGKITTVAGTGIAGYSGDGGSATAAKLNAASGVVVDNTGNLLIADLRNSRVRKVIGIAAINPKTVSASVTGGNGSITPTSVSFNSGNNVTLTITPAAGYHLATLTDNGANVIGRVSGNVFTINNVTVSHIVVASFAVNMPYPGNILTIAGSGTAGFSGDGGPATSGMIGTAYVGVAIDRAGNMFIADYNNHRIRKVNTTGIITAVAGTGTAGFSGDGGPATAAQLYYPSGITVDSIGNLYIADEYNNRIRKIDTSGKITTVAGNGTVGFSGDGGPATGAQLYYPISVSIDNAGNLFIADGWNNRIRKVNTSGTITTVAGTGTGGHSGDGGPATEAQLYHPSGVTVDTAGNLFIADFANNRIRKVNTSGTIITVAGAGSAGPVTFVNGSVSATYFGTGTAGFSGDGGPAAAAQLFNPFNIAVDSTGNLFIADYGNNRIRKIDSSGTITTVVGNGTVVFSGDGGPATSASLYLPTSVAFDNAGNLLIADSLHARIRKVIAPAIMQLPRTGQTTCYDTSGAVIICAGTGQDGDELAGKSWSLPRFTDNGDQTMTDKVTGLVWTKNANAPGPLACSPGTIKNWQDALDYVKCLNSNNYLNKNDWRLPNRIELESLIDRQQASPATALMGLGFTNVQSADYYSSTTFNGQPTHVAWHISMADGSVTVFGYVKTSGGYNVWPVRGGEWGGVVLLPRTGQTKCYNSADAVIPCANTGQDGDKLMGAAWPMPRFTDNGNGAVTDNLTGLIWTKNASCFGARTWLNALNDTSNLVGNNSQCDLNDGSMAGDWRLPNIKELQSLTDMQSSYPALSPGHPFISLSAGNYFWTSNTVVGSTSSAWYASFFEGFVSNSSKVANNVVWPVRGGQFGNSVFSVLPASKDFGSVPVLGSASQIVTISNNGTTSRMHINAMSFYGTNAGEFSLNVGDGSGGTCGSTIPIIPAGASCSVIVSFNPASSGAKTATLRIGSSDVNMPYKDIPLSGTAIPGIVVTPSVGPNGTIIPNTNPITVASGSTPSFTLAPTSGYQAANIVGGTCPLGSFNGNIYTTGTITANCSVSFSFVPTSVTITTTTSGNGIITCVPGMTVNYGTSVSCTATAAVGNHITLVAVDGAGQTITDSTTFTYSFGNVTANHTMNAIFAINTYNVTATVIGGNGSITPASSTVNAGVSVNLDIVPARCYNLATLTDNGSNVLGSVSNGSYTITNIITNHAVLGSFVADAVPPVLAISTLPDGSYTNNNVLNINGTVTDNCGFKELTINSTVVPVNPNGTFSYALVLNIGPNLITTIATDLIGNQTTDTRTITLDQTAPKLVIITPADNSKTANPLATVSGTVDETSTVTVELINSLGSYRQTATMNGTNFTTDLNLAPGTNTILVTATDLAGNPSSGNRTVIYDDQAPSLAITFPAQDISTNQATLTIRGTASDPYTAVTVSITMDGQTYTPAVVNGQFEQTVTFTTAKSYAIIVTATNEAGTSTTVQRNVILLTSGSYLGELIKALLESGAITPKTADTLRASLATALVAYSNKTNGDQMMNRFINDVNAAENSGKISAGTANLLVNAANNVIASQGK